MLAAQAPPTAPAMTSPDMPITFAVPTNPIAPLSSLTPPFAPTAAGISMHGIARTSHRVGSAASRAREAFIRTVIAGLAARKRIAEGRAATPNWLP